MFVKETVYINYKILAVEQLKQKFALQLKQMFFEKKSLIQNIISFSKIVNLKMIKAKDSKNKKWRKHMKKIVMLGLLAIGSIVMADSAQDVLRKAREDYYKQQKEGARPAKGERKVSRTQVNGDGTETVQEVTLDTEEEVVEEAKPKTPMEKLEYNAAKAKDRVDFYERVVRSVEREEKELSGYDEVLGRNKKKNAKKATTKKVRERKTNKK